MKRVFWFAVFTCCSLGLFRVAVSRRAYTATLMNFKYPVALRKTYALGAFALLGFLLQRASFPGLRATLPVAVCVGLYSTAIEIAQVRIAHTNPGRRRHAFDILSGVVGGAVGFRIARSFGRTES